MEAVVDYIDVDVLHRELTVVQSESRDIVSDEGGGLRLGVVVVFAREGQGGRIDGVREFDFVAGVAGKIERPSHEEQDRNSNSDEEDEEAAAFVLQQLAGFSQQSTYHVKNRSDDDHLPDYKQECYFNVSAEN